MRATWPAKTLYLFIQISFVPWTQRTEFIPVLEILERQ